MFDKIVAILMGTVACCPHCKGRVADYSHGWTLEANPVCLSCRKDVELQPGPDDRAA